MSDNIQHLDLDDDEFFDAPKALRDYAKKLQAQNKTLSNDLASAKGQVASQALSGVLADFKSPAKVKRDLLADGIDATDQGAVEKWLSENGDDYAKAAASQESATQTQVPDEERLAHEAIQTGAEFKQPSDMSKLEAAMAEIPKDASGADLIEAYRKHGL